MYALMRVHRTNTQILLDNNNNSTKICLDAQCNQSEVTNYISLS